MATDLFAEALTLPERERRALAHALLDSLPREVDHYSLTPAQQHELERRLAAIDSGGETGSYTVAQAMAAAEERIGYQK
jgi:putative addiction module component (TIGR02574 family)